MRKLYLAGTGNVSKNLLSLISNLNSDIKIMGIENSRGQLFSEESLSMADINNFMKSPGDYRKSLNISKMDFDIYVDMRTASKNGERERDDYITLMKNGKHIVTANKSGLANFFPEFKFIHWDILPVCSDPDPVCALACIIKFKHIIM